MNIGRKIKEARLAKGLTQEQLGSLIGLQKSAIAKYENGRGQIPVPGVPTRFHLSEYPTQDFEPLCNHCTS